jgi:hypothetical protein
METGVVERCVEGVEQVVLVRQPVERADRREDAADPGTCGF